ncbi:MAG: sigma-70 family RNA polymerase sigma factor [Alphaproteobacteria bacterium]|nr:sigma-70 family RNA polymerase sigma factor [Alphaproteobacteria bacterium]
MPPLPDSDDALMARYSQTGERACYEALFRAWAPRLNSYFLRHVGDPNRAQDMVQLTFLHVHRARKDFRAGSPFRPWVYTIAANVRRQHFRRKARKPEAAWDPDRHREPAVGPDASTAEQRLVRRALAQLPDGQREVVLLHWYEGLGFKEIAEIVGASHSAVKVRAHRAYQALRELLDADR